MVSLPLIHGATRIGFYSFRHVTGKMGVTFAEENPDVWNSLKDVDAELAQIGPFLLDAKPDASVTLKERDSGVNSCRLARRFAPHPARESHGHRAGIAPRICSSAGRNSQTDPPRNQCGEPRRHRKSETRSKRDGGAAGVSCVRIAHPACRNL